MKEGLYTKKLKADRIICSLCYHQCLIPPGSRGICNVKENKKGKLYSLNYKKYSKECPVDIEDVPMFHYLPGTKSYLLSTMGDNFSMENEENFDKNLKKLKRITPLQAVKRAIKNECSSVAFNGEEPTMYLESIKEVAKIARSKRIKNIALTNGYAYENAAKEMRKLIHAMTFRLDTADKEEFLSMYNAKLNYVQKNIKTAIDEGTWVEILTVLPDEINEGEIIKLVDYVSEFGDIPWHIRNADEDQKAAIKENCKEKMNFVYFNKENTFCPKCGEIVIDRNKNEVNIKKNQCPKCKKKIPGVF